MDIAYSKAYAEVYRRHWWWRAREEVVVETLLRHWPKEGYETILDVGCGDGLFFDRLSEFGNVEGVEPETEILSDRFRNKIHAVEFDDRFQPGRRYSLILMLDVLEHLPDPAAGFRHAVDLLVPGGIVIITLPAFQILWTKHDEMNHHVRRYTRRSFHALADGAGLDFLEERYFFQALFPLKLALRPVEALLHLSPRLPSVPPTWLNSAVRGYFRAEERILRNLHVPFGTSLLVVAKKRTYCAE
jgi:SAM-dependent methyltransferase